jgi:hypothetical protein
MLILFLFPRQPPSEGPLKDAIRQLVAWTGKLLDLGDNWGNDGRGSRPSSAPLQFDVANLRDSVYSCAYEVAKATKEVATIVEAQRANEAA